MSKFLHFLILIVLFTSVCSVQAQKTWVGANNGNWNLGSNWSPSGAPGAGDNVIISSSHNININTSATINRLTITGNAAVTFTASGAARTITIDDTGSSIDTGSSLTLVGTTGGGGTRTMGLAFTGANETMSIAGTLNLTPTAAGSIYNATNSITTVTGSIVRTGGSITSTASNLSFSSGGVYQHSMNGSTIPTATWNAASTCLITGITGTIPSSGLGQSFGNLHGIVQDSQVQLTT